MTTASYCTANGVKVLRASITRSMRGAWYADLEIDSQTLPNVGDPMTVLVSGESGSVSIVGSVARAGLFVDKLHVRAVGGKGGLPKPLPSRAYLRTPASIPLADIAAEAGETLSTTTSIDQFLRRFIRPADVASAALDLLADIMGVTWRVLDDGTIFFGTETFPDAGVTTFDLVGSMPEDDRVDIALDVPSLRPGTTFQGRRVGRVIDTIEASSVRTTAYYVQQ